MEGEQYEVLGVELEFRAPLVNPETGAASRTFQRAGKVDVVVRDATGRKLLVEHKTSARTSALDRASGRACAWAARPQDTSEAPRRSGTTSTASSTTWRRSPSCGRSRRRRSRSASTRTREDGQAANVPSRARLYANQRETDETVDEYRDRVRAAIAEDPEKYFQRGLVVRLEDNLAEADGELWQLGQTLREHHRLQLAPRNTDACQRYGSTCTYFAICAGEASADDDRQYRRLHWPHPELTNPKEEG
jgi:hypothetical protein